MSNEKVIVTTSKLDALATSIAQKTGVSTPLTIAEMKTAVDSLSSGGITPTGTINITENGTYNISTYASANVSVNATASPFIELLLSYSVPSATNAIKIDFTSSWKNSYNFYIIECDFTLSESDWVYFGFDTQNPSKWQGSASTFNFIFKGDWNNGWTAKYSQNGKFTQASFPEYFYFKTYVDSKMFNVGSTIKIYGCSFTQGGN